MSKLIEFYWNNVNISDPLIQISLVLKMQLKCHLYMTFCMKKICYFNLNCWVAIADVIIKNIWIGENSEGNKYYNEPPNRDATSND